MITNISRKGILWAKHRKKNVTGMNSKASFGNSAAASCGLLYPPLCGIVQLTNSAALRFRNWSFTITKEVLL